MARWHSTQGYCVKNKATAAVAATVLAPLIDLIPRLCSLRSCMSCSGHIRPARPRTGTVAAPITICLSVLVTPPPLQAPDSGVNASLDSKPTRCSSKTQRFLYLYSSLGSFGARPEITLTQVQIPAGASEPLLAELDSVAPGSLPRIRILVRTQAGRHATSKIHCGGVIYAAAVLSTQ